MKKVPDYRVVIKYGDVEESGTFKTYWEAMEFVRKYEAFNPLVEWSLSDIDIDD